MTARALIPMPLPDPCIRTQWHIVTPEFRRTTAYWPHIEAAARETAKRPGWHPKTVQMGGFMVALDYSFQPNSDEVSAYKTGLVMDHPFLRALPPNCPRVVRHIYRREVRLKYIFASSAWDLMRDLAAAESAAQDYNAATERLLT